LLQNYTTQPQPNFVRDFQSIEEGAEISTADTHLGRKFGSCTASNLHRTTPT